MYKICELSDSLLEFCFALSAPGVSLDRALCCVPGCSSQSVSVDDHKNWAGNKQGVGEKKRGQFPTSTFPSWVSLIADAASH